LFVVLVDEPSPSLVSKMLEYQCVVDFRMFSFGGGVVYVNWGVVSSPVEDEHFFWSGWLVLVWCLSQCALLLSLPAVCAYDQRLVRWVYLGGGKLDTTSGEVNLELFCPLLSLLCNPRNRRLTHSRNTVVLFFLLEDGVVERNSQGKKEKGAKKILVLLQPLQKKGPK
jgi:hypothetical protein